MQIDELLERAGGAGPEATRAIDAVTRWRQQIAQRILAVGDDDVKAHATFAAALDRVIQWPLPFSAGAEGYELAARVLDIWVSQPAPSVKVILAGIATMPAHHLPPPPALSSVPKWLRPQYARYLLAAPKIFMHAGEADRLAAHQMQSMARIHEAIFSDQSSDANLLADAVAQSTCNMMYFNEQNLRPYFLKRAEILEWKLTQEGHELTFSADLAARRVPRIGVLHSARTQTESLYLLAHLEGRPHAAMEVILYSFQSEGERLLTELSRWVDQTVVLPEGTSESVARIREDDLDLMLVSNNIVHNMTPLASIAAHRLARIQVASTASPSTTGFSSFDLYLSGELNEARESAQNHYAERLALLRGSVTYYAFGHDRDEATFSPSRQQLGVRDDQIVFFSAANYFKILPETFQVWAEILARDPRAVLVLMPFNPNWGSNYPRAYFRLRLNRELLRAGVALRRVIILNSVRSRADLHNIMRHTDIYLDSFPFAGACSLVDPLQVAIPIVARDGKTFRSSVAGAMLRAQGLKDVISSDNEAYIDRAIALASDSHLRDAERDRIRRVTSPVPECIRTVDYAHRFTSFCASAVVAWQSRVNTHRAADLRTLCDTAVSTALMTRAREFRRLTDVRIITDLIVPCLKTRRAEGRTGGHVIDIGACVGETARPFLDAEFSVDMFEPDPECAERLAQLCRPHKGRATHHQEAVVPGDGGMGSLQKRTMGLSSLGESPFGATDTELPVRTRSASEIWSGQADMVDFIKIDAEGFDLEILNGIDFEKCRPSLIMIEFGLHFAKHSLDAIERTYVRMGAAGYSGAIFEIRKLDGFGVTNWASELADLYFVPAKPKGRGDGLGNMVFFRTDDTLFPTVLVAFLETLLPARKRPTFAVKGDDAAWLPPP